MKMSIDKFSQRITEIIEALEALRTRSLVSPDDASAFQDDLGQLQISIKELPSLARGEA